MCGAVDFSAVVICSHRYSYVPEHVLLLHFYRKKYSIKYVYLQDEIVKIL